MTRKHTRAPSQRQLRVGEALRHALAEILARGELRDPALADVQATVTEVRVSPDLKAATAFVVPFGGGDAAALAKALNNAAGFFRMRLAAPSICAWRRWSASSPTGPSTRSCASSGS